VLYAAYPAGKLSRSDLRVLSVSGSADGLATPAKIQAAKADLPASTRYVVVAGGVHSFFGDYGVQSGDGTPTTSQAAAQAQVVTSTRALLASLAPRPKPPAKKR
jgi:dienelactone hydrolase